VLVDEETGALFLECGAVCAYAPLWLSLAIQSSQSGAYAQTAPHSKYVRYSACGRYDQAPTLANYTWRRRVRTYD